ncbi:hypothetical protein E3J20_04695 [Candidatus Bathyarchaeota archaeon]|nr:MAG: hypothetical protein E3J20_04695 [Candidatus Bathyarchaeota archaeon]
MSELLSLMVSLIGSLVSAQQTNGMPLGYIVLIVVESPVLILLLAALLGKPRKMKVSMLFMAWLAMVFVVFIVSVYALSFITGLFY